MTQISQSTFAIDSSDASVVCIKVGDLALQRIKALQYRRGGERVAMVAAVLQLVIPSTDYIILDVKLTVWALSQVA